jgi:argininosuccinate synthase
MFRLTVDPESAPEEPLELTIGVEAGDPVSIDGEVLGPVELLSRLNAIAGAHGVGRIDIVENRFVGIKSRGVYETPGGTLMHQARRAIESLVLDREVLHLRDSLATRYATMVYNGFWFSPERLALQSMMDSIQERVTGEARLVLYKGSVRTTGRRSPNSAYDPEVATFEAEEVYRQADAAGFISLNALRIRGFGDGT